MSQLQLSSSYISAKNQTSDDEPWFVLAEIKYGPAAGDVLRLCANTEDVVWNGYTWTRFPFTVESIRESRKEVPKTVVRVGNQNRQVQTYLEQYGGGVGYPVTFYVVYNGDLTETTRIPTFSFKTTACKCDSKWATFTLGATSPYNRNDPKHRMLKNFCRFGFPNSDDPRCPYTGVTYESCNRTLAACITRNGSDAKYFGGHPSMGTNAIYVS